MSSLTGMIYEVARWIEPGVIAESLFGIEGVETELADGLERSAKAVLGKGE